MVKQQAADGLDAVLEGIRLGQSQENEGDDRATLVESIYIMRQMWIFFVCFMVHGGSLALGDS